MNGYDVIERFIDVTPEEEIRQNTLVSSVLDLIEAPLDAVSPDLIIFGEAVLHSGADIVGQSYGSLIEIRLTINGSIAAAYLGIEAPTFEVVE